MQRYIGADVHSASVTFVVLNKSGKKIRQDVVETNGQALVGYIQQIPGSLHLCIEESEWSLWLYEIFSPYVTEVIVYRSQRTYGPKNDAIDAHGLAEKLRMGKVTNPVFKAVKQFRALREAARTYTMLTRDVVRVKNRIKSLYRSRGIPCPGEAAYKPEERIKRSQALPPPMRRSLDLLGAELDHLIKLKELSESQMLKASHCHRISHILETVPGLGPIRVAQMLPIVVTPHRFRTKRQFWSYSGFGIMTRSSADWVMQNGRWMKMHVVQTRGLSFGHNRTLKSIFKGAATTAISISKPNPLRDAYDRLLENGTKPNLAKLTIARKIAAITLAMWKKEVRYNPDKIR